MNDWVKYVMENYTSTDPPPGIFTKSAREIADAWKIPGVAPKGIVSWIRMCWFHYNRGGEKLANRDEVRQAIRLLNRERMGLK